MIHIANEVVAQTVRVAQVIILAALLLVAYYATDRNPPFAVLSVVPASARPGEYITIQATVRRDIDRKCSAEMSRYLYDASGARFDIGQSLVSSGMIEHLERTSPSVLRVSVRVPESMSVGPANLQTVLAYKCNKTHNIWPIEVTTDLPFLVVE